jgi:nicotinate phosphoribosyltransferase
MHNGDTSNLPRFKPVSCRLSDRFYSDTYFNRTQDTLHATGHDPRVRMQFFQRQDHACLCGIEEAVQLMTTLSDSHLSSLQFHSLSDGERIDAGETMMIAEGPYSILAPLETLLLGILARNTRVATNTSHCVRAAHGKPVFCFSARFDHYLMQPWDGYAYQVGCRAAHREPFGVSSNAQGIWWSAQGIGTIPHGLIAAYGGDTIAATLAFAETTAPDVPRIALVDFTNDCVQATLDVAAAMLAKHQEQQDDRYLLQGVRLDTASDMVDASLQNSPDTKSQTGVCPELVWNVHRALTEQAGHYPDNSPEHRFYTDIDIIVSGGFTPARIKAFEAAGVPVAAYGVGSALFAGHYDFTADVVSLLENGEWRDCAKTGRQYNPNERLQEWSNR